jgi:hypothetical protein
LFLPGNAVHEDVLTARGQALECEERGISRDVVDDDGIACGPSSRDPHLRPRNRDRARETAHTELLESCRIEREVLRSALVALRIVDRHRRRASARIRKNDGDVRAIAGGPVR